jgi:hypothetical protein
VELAVLAGVGRNALAAHHPHQPDVVEPSAQELEGVSQPGQSRRVGDAHGLADGAQQGGQVLVERRRRLGLGLTLGLGCRCLGLTLGLGGLVSLGGVARGVGGFGGSPGVGGSPGTLRFRRCRLGG